MKQKVNCKVNVVGSVIEIIDSKNKSLVGVCGKILDETKHTLIIDCEKKKISVMKNHIIFRKNDDGMIIDGKKIDNDLALRLKQK